MLWFKNIDLHSSDTALCLLKSGLAAQIKAVGHGVFFGVTKLVLPIHQSVIYGSSDSAVWFVPAALAAILLALLFITRERFGRGLFVAIAIFFLLTGASVNWFDASRLSVITDAAFYLAVVPLLVVIVAGFVAQFRRLNLHGPVPAVAVSSTLVLVLGFPTWLRTHVFESSVTLWENTLLTHPGDAFVEAALAEQLRLRALVDTTEQNKDAMDSDFALATLHAQSAIQHDPGNAQAQHTMASILVAQGDDAASLSHFRAAVSADPQNAEILAEYGSALVTLGRFEQAIVQLNRSLMNNPASAVAHRLLGKAYFGLNHFDRAIIEEQTALGIDFNDLIAREALADAQAKAGNIKDAIQSYAMVMADPAQQNRPDLWMEIAQLKDRQTDYDLSVQYMQTAQKLAHSATENASTEQEKATATLKEKQINDAVAVELQKQKVAASTRPSAGSTTMPSSAPALK